MCKNKILEQELRLRFSDQTVKCYMRQFSLFMDYFSGQDLRYISLIEIKDYILSLSKYYKYSSIVHAVSVIKFYYKHINPRKRIIDIPLPRKPKTIPTVLSKNEVKRIIENIDNLKHRAIIETIFFHGLRRSELINLKIKDIDSENMILCVTKGKRNKDRNIPLSDQCLETLRKYFIQFKPKEYLFNGQGLEKYSASSMASILKRAVLRSEIKKDVTLHSLRHSFASYLVEINTSLPKIQSWLGHSSIKTTEIYCHIKHESNPIFI